MDYIDGVDAPPLVTVVETPEFITRAERLLPPDERDALILYLAARPTAGDIVPGTGGVRKLRWALPGRGRRGGARVIYFFHSLEVPLFALTIFAKNERTDLSHADRHELRQLTKLLVDAYYRRRES